MYVKVNAFFKIIYIREIRGSAENSDHYTIDLGLEILHKHSRQIIWATTCDFQQCGILTSVDSDEPVYLQTPNGIQSVA